MTNDLLRPAPTKIPARLRRHPYWCVWKAEKARKRDGTIRIRKVPYNARTGRRADKTNRDDAVPFEEAVAAYETGLYAGIGVFLFEDDDLVAGDEDDCFDENGRLEPSVAERIRLIDTYTERSPSGTGLRWFAEGKKPGSRCRRGGFEMYDRAWFLTVTGHHLADTPRTVRARQTQIETLYERIFGEKRRRTAMRPSRPAASHDLSDRELLAKARAASNGRRFAALYDRGDLSAYDGDHSRADAALVEMLLWWTQGDTRRTDRLFRGSALMRDKWDERRGDETYGSITIGKMRGEMDAFYTSNGSGSGARGSGHIQSAAPRSRRRIPLTDYGNAERLVARHGSDLLYSFSMGRWFVWTGRRWKDDSGGAVMRRAKETARSIRQEAANEPDQDRAKKVFGHALRSEGEARLNAMISLARSEPEIDVDADALDADPYFFNVENGTVDLRTGELLPHDRSHLITKKAPVAYDSLARAPRFYRFLQEIFAGNEELIMYLQRLLGYTLTGLILEQVLPILFGFGANGKSTLLELIRRILGDYAMHTPTDTLKPRRGGIPNDLARLRGARFVSAVETGQQHTLNESLVKQVTGGEPITARFLRKEFFEFHPTFKVFLATNHKPTITGTDEGIWRRIHLIPFEVRFSKEERDAELGDKLLEERAGILNWLIEGCLDWQDHGLQAPPAVVEATATYRGEMDILGAFLDECCRVDGGSIQPEVQASALYKAYKAWCERTGESCQTQTMFGRHMSQRGFARKKKSDGVWYRGISLPPRHTDVPF